MISSLPRELPIYIIPMGKPADKQFRALTLEEIPAMAVIAEYVGKITLRKHTAGKKALEDLLLAESEHSDWVIDPSTNSNIARYLSGTSQAMREHDDQIKKPSQWWTNCGMKIFSGPQPRAFLYSLRKIEEFEFLYWDYHKGNPEEPSRAESVEYAYKHKVDYAEQKKIEREMLRFMNHAPAVATSRIRRTVMPRSMMTNEEKLETGMPTTLVEVKDILADALRLPMEYEEFVRTQAELISVYVKDDEKLLAFTSAHHLKNVVRKRDFKAETKRELWAATHTIDLKLASQAMFADANLFSIGIKEGDIIVWFDSEGTKLFDEEDGVEPEALEQCIKITDTDYTVLDKISEPIAHKKKLILNDWSIDHHYASGLMDAVADAKFSTEQVEQLFIDFLKPYHHFNVAGRSLWRYDWRLLELQMPRLYAFLEEKRVNILEAELVFGPHCRPKDRTHRAEADVDLMIEHAKLIERMNVTR